MAPSDSRIALCKVLARYPAIVQARTEPEPLGNAGGLSGAELWRFVAGRGTLVARAWPPEGPHRPALETIHRWITLAGKVGFLAVPIAALDGRTVQQEAGRLWEITPWLNGAANDPETTGPAQLDAAFTALGALHVALQGEGAMSPSGGLRDRVRDIEWWLARGFAALERTLAHAGQDPCAPLALQWLTDARRAVPRWLEALKGAAATLVWCQPCLRDARPEHFLFDAGRVSGLVDYGAMGVDSVAGDLARLLSEWVGADRAARARALAAYTAIRTLDERETALIAAFETSAALLGAGRWAAWHFLEGRPFRDPHAVARGLHKGVARLTQRLVADIA